MWNYSFLNFEQSGLSCEENLKKFSSEITEPHKLAYFVDYGLEKAIVNAGLSFVMSLLFGVYYKRNFGEQPLNFRAPLFGLDRILEEIGNFDRDDLCKSAINSMSIWLILERNDSFLSHANGVAVMM